MTRFSLSVLVAVSLGVFVFLGAALAGSDARATNYTVRQGDTATWPSVKVACQLVSNGQAAPLVCGNSGRGRGSGVIITRSTITVYDRTGKEVFVQKRTS
jgi:hypothetical protein